MWSVCLNGVNCPDCVSTSRQQRKDAQTAVRLRRCHQLQSDGLVFAIENNMLQEYDRVCRMVCGGCALYGMLSYSFASAHESTRAWGMNLYLVKTIMVRLMVVAIAATPVSAYARAQITPHMATYEVRLSKVIGPDAPRSLSGTLVYLVKDRCDGYVQESTIDLVIEQRNTPPTRFGQTFESFERHDQTGSTFALRVTAGGREVDRYTGNIEREADGVTMVYDRLAPDNEDSAKQTYQAPADTLLSLAFTAFVADQAKLGERFTSRVIADGLLEDGPNRLSAVIGPQANELPSYPDPEGLLKGKPWPVSLAYYPVADASELPTQEMRISLFSGGIVTEIDQNLGDYSVVTSLIDLQSAPGCND